MTNIDYQWPSGKLQIPSEYRLGGDSECFAIQAEIESYFADRYGYPVLLLPSGRAALSLALQLAGTSRGQTVFASKWSSQCVWNIVGKYADPTSMLSANVDVMIAIYKFGRIEENLAEYKPRMLIEDSCDSLIVNRLALLPSNGICEIFSLPKIMGSYAGGLLMCASAEVAENARHIISNSIPIGVDQGYLKWHSVKNSNDGYEFWDVREYKNFHPDYTLLSHLSDNLWALEKNAETIKTRIFLLREKFPDFFIDDCYRDIDVRLPPVVSIPKAIMSQNELMRRHLNVTNRFDDQRYENLRLIPLHFGVSDAIFNDILNRLIRH